MSEFMFLTHDAGFNSTSTVDFLDISASTYRRYKQGPAPQMAILSIAHQAGIAEGWEGFKILPGRIITPSGDEIHRNQIESYKYAAYLNQCIGFVWHGSKPECMLQTNRCFKTEKPLKKVDLQREFPL